MPILITQKNKYSQELIVKDRRHMLALGVRTLKIKPKIFSSINKLRLSKLVVKHQMTMTEWRISQLMKILKIIQQKIKFSHIEIINSSHALLSIKKVYLPLA
jgi:hypothetical protein